MCITIVAIKVDNSITCGRGGGGIYHSQAKFRNSVGTCLYGRPLQCSEVFCLGHTFLSAHLH